MIPENALLRNNISPYNIIDSAKEVVSPNGSIIFNFTNLVTGYYYIELVHRNSIKTWSANPIGMINGSSTNYYFTNLQTQSYGNNSKLVDTSPLLNAIYSGMSIGIM